MMSRAPRWNDIPGPNKTNKPSQKTGGKEPAASTAPLSSGGKQAANSASKTRVGARRSHSLGRGGDSASSGSKSSGSLKRDQASRQSGGRPALRLCSSFSSLHTPSLSAPTFVRSSRSLSRLDQRAGGDDAVLRTHVRNGRALEKRGLSSDHLFSEEYTRDNKGHCGDDNGEKMKTNSSSVPPESYSSTDSTAECHHHCNSVKKQELKRSSLPRYRRLQSLQVRGAEASAVPDLLDFKKGWMMLQDASGQWQRHWFVLTDQNLKFYKDSVAEEAAGADGEINLSTCFDITEYPPQKDNGFQLHTRDGVYTLCAMTSGMRHNWVQAVLKNVRTGHTPDVNCSFPAPPSQQKAQQQEPQSADKTEHQTSDCALETHLQQKDREVKLQPQQEHSCTDGGSASTTLFPPFTSPQQVEECECGGSSCHHCKHLSAQTAVADPSSSVEGTGGDSSTSKTMQLVEKGTEQSTTGSKEQQESSKISHECKVVEDGVPCEQQTWQLVKELEQTQKELSRLQQQNRNLLDELQQARESHAKEAAQLQTPLEALALQRLQKVNEDLRTELEAQKKNQDEARETELRRRVDLLAQQAQLLVTGDATALAQAQMEQDRRRFYQLQVEWERCVASLKSQLSYSEEQRKEAETRHTRLQQELQNFHSLQEEAERLQQNLQEVTKQLQANEEAQAQKETRLQKHLMLLQASQDRERRSLTSSLAQAEQHSQDLQERLDRAQQQLENLTKTQSWTREIEMAQQQLQEELERTIAAVQDLQEEKQQLDRRCQELQNQLLEADEEVSRLQSRLTSDETHYYNLEHTYERVCEELQMALGKVQQKEAEMQEMREGYERLLDRKEQELSEVLLKMEVLGNSLEETELKLNEMSNACSSSQAEKESSAPERQEQTIDLEVNTGLPPAGAHSHSAESSYQSLVAAGDDPERFMTVIQTLENKLYVTEEKLRDIMQRLGDHQSHLSCQDPQLCSQLTQSRATAQHLSLLLHSQAKQSQRFAQETESLCRMLASRFQVALNIVQACRGKLEMAPINVPELERQLATIAACLQQGEKDAERQQRESRIASKGEEKILNDETLPGAENNRVTQSKFMLPSEDDTGTVGRCLLKELFVVEKMVSILQKQCGIRRLVPTEDEEDVVHRYKSIISQTIVLKTENSRVEYDCTEKAIDRVCAETELVYAAFKHLQEYESVTQDNDQDEEALRKTLADVSPPELAPYEEQEKDVDGGLDEAGKPLEKDESDLKEAEGERESDWLDRLISHLQKRAKCLRQLCQETSDGEERRMRENWEIASVAGLKWIEEQAKLIYLSARMSLDLEQETQRRKVLQDQLQALCNVQHIAIKEELEAFNHTLCRLQEDNSVLREELERAEQKIISVETGNQRLQEDIQKIQHYHKERMEKLEVEFQEKIKELQHIHEEEMKHLHSFYSKSCASKEKQTRTSTEAAALTGSAPSLLEHTVLGSETKEASSEEGFPAVEEMHKKLIGDLEQQHQMQVAALLKEKEQLLQEETSATMAAIVAMRRAHKQELEKSRHTQHLRENADITELHVQHEKELQSLHKELEALSVQHTQKCLENSQLQQQLHDERQSLMQCQKENQELQKKQRDTDETSQPHLSLNGKQPHVASHVDDFYEMEVILRAREAEMQFLRQEAHSLREELKIARMDKMYAQNKLQALCTKAQDESGHNVSKVRDETKFATWSYSKNAPRQESEDAVTGLSGAAFLKKTVKSSLTRQIRGVRSKSLKEGLSTQEKMKLFESF